MDFIVGILGLIVLIVLTIIYVIYIYIVEFFKLFLGQRKYVYTKILSHGMKEVYEWHKNDEEALKYHKDFEFISMVKPFNKQLKPLK